jgi:hypothetical protein
MVWNLVQKVFTGIQGKIIFAMAVSGYCIVMFWLFWPYNPMEIHSINIINPGGVYPGGSLVYEVDYTKPKIYPVVSVTRQLTNDAVIVLAPGSPSTLPIGRHKVKVVAKLPEYIGLGTHFLTVTAQYRVNHIRTISVSATSKSFDVIEKVDEKWN